LLHLGQDIFGVHKTEPPAWQMHSSQSSLSKAAPILYLKYVQFVKVQL
jgi:hypothetical protein